MNDSRFLYRRYQSSDLDSVLELVTPEMKTVLPDLTLTPTLLAAALDQDPWQDHLREPSNRELVVMERLENKKIEVLMDGVLYPGARGVRVLLNGFFCGNNDAMNAMFDILSTRCRGMGCGLLYLHGRFPLGLGWLGHPDPMEVTRKHLYNVGFLPATPFYQVMRSGEALPVLKDTTEEWKESDNRFELTLIEDGEGVAHCEVCRTPPWLRETPYGDWGVIEVTQEINDRLGEGWGREVLARMTARLAQKGIRNLINCVNVDKSQFWSEANFTPMLFTKTLERPLPM